MDNLLMHIKKTKQILLICFIFFALSPCVVKDLLFNSINITNSKPLNRIKTSQINSCNYLNNTNQLTSNYKNQQSIKKVKLVDYVYRNKVEDKLFINFNSYSKRFTGNSPPKYILYKRLKIDLL